MKKIYILITALLATSIIYFPAFAHPGNTAADGCHYCRTNCDSWGVAWNERHCHGGSVAPPPVYIPPKPIYVPKVTSSYDYKYEDVLFETKYEDDQNLEIGKEVVKQDGANGKKTITFKVTKTDGLETGRVQEKEAVTLQPIDKIIARGTRQVPVAAPVENNGDKEVKGEVASQQINDPFAALMGFLIVVGFPTWIIWLVIRSVKKNNT